MIRLPDLGRLQRICAESSVPDQNERFRPPVVRYRGLLHALKSLLEFFKKLLGLVQFSQDFLITLERDQ